MRIPAARSAAAPARCRGRRRSAARQQRVEQDVARRAAPRSSPPRSAPAGRRATPRRAPSCEVRAVVGDLGPDRPLRRGRADRRARARRSAARRCGAGGSKPISVPRASSRIGSGCCAPMLAGGSWSDLRDATALGLGRLSRSWSRSRSRIARPRSRSRARRRRAARSAARALARGRHAAALRAPAALRDDHRDRRRDRAVGLHRDQQPRRRSLLASGAIAAAIIGFAARQTLANFSRRDHARGHAADPRRRLGDVRGQLRRRRGRAPQLHGPAHRRPSSGSDHPERAARRRDPQERHAEVDVVALDVSVWMPPEADVERAIAR